MKRLLITVCVVAFLTALPLSHLVMAEPVEKVNICHVNSANDDIKLGEIFGVSVLMGFGKEIEVAPAAVPAHTEHGDREKYLPIDEDARELLETIFEVKLPNADCWFIELVKDEPE